MKILVVEDNPLIAQTLQLLLNSYHYAVDIAADGEVGAQMADAFDYDLVLLDIILPRLDGLSLCQQLREKGFQAPILLLTVQGGAHQKAIALKAGADDYVVKPFDAEELIARIQSLLRQDEPQSDPILSEGHVSTDPNGEDLSGEDLGEENLKVTDSLDRLGGDRPPNHLHPDQWQALFEYALDAMVIADDEGCYVDANPAACKLFGLSKVQLLQQNVANFAAPDLDFAQLWFEFIQAGQQSGEFSLHRLDGTILETEFTAIANFIPGRHLSILRDISDRKQVERKQQEISQALSHAVEGISRLDPQGRYLFVNHAYAQMVGYTSQEMVGMDWQRTVHPEDLEAAIAQYQQMLRLGKVELEVRGLRKDGSVFDKHLFMVSAYDQQQFTGHYCFMRDVSQRKQTEKALQLSQERFQLAIEGSGDGLWDWNLVTDEVYLSPQWLAMLGYKEGDLPNHVSTWERVIHPEDRPWVMDRLNAHLKDSRCPYQFDYRVQTQSGEWKWIGNYGKVVVRDPQGTPLRMTGLHKDIGDRKQAEVRLRQQALMFESISDGVILTDPEGCIMDWNPAAQKIYGYTKSEVLGQKLGLLNGPKNNLEIIADSSRVNDLQINNLQTHDQAHDQAHDIQAQVAIPEWDAIQQALIVTDEWRGELQQVTKTGQEIIVASRWTLLRDARGHPQTLVIANTDITETKRLEAQFFQAQRQESLGSLASGIAHDLNNILTPILGIAQTLRMTQQPLEGPKAQKLLQIVENSAKKGANMVKQILTFVKGSDEERVPIKLLPLLQDVVSIAQHSFPDAIKIRQNILETEGLDQPLGVVLADPTHLHQVFMNLCINARDAMPEGGYLTITVENYVVTQGFARRHMDAQAGPHVLVTIADTGVGIAPQVRDRIFEPFFTTKEVGKGTGLGLSTALGIVKNYGGFLQVFSEVGQGTQVKVYLPTTDEPPVEVSQ